MKIGSLFVQLFSKGGGDVSKQLSTIKDGMVDAKMKAFAMKAAIVGAVFGFERLMSFSAKTGAGLKEFSMLTGLSTEQLQKYQFAGRQFNATNESIAGSIKAMQSAIGRQMLEGGAVLGLEQLQLEVGFDITRAEHDIDYAMQKLQQFAATTSIGVVKRNEILRSFGISDDVISAMAQMAFTRKNMANAPLFNNQDRDALAKMNAEMAEFYNSLKMSVGVLMSAVGPEITSGLKDISKMIFDFANGINKNSSALLGFKTMIAGIFDVIKIGTQLIIKLFEIIGNFTSGFDKFTDESLDKNFGGALGDLFNKSIKGIVDSLGLDIIDNKTIENVVPKSNEIIVPQNKSTQSNSININQSLNFNGDGENAREVGREVKTSSTDVFQQAFRQLNSQYV